MRRTIQTCPGRLMATMVVALLSCAIISCNQKSSQPESVQFTADELYLIAAYVDVRRAGSYYPYQSAIAESLFVGLSASVDTVRIAHTIAAINLDPDRWAFVYQEIEDRLRDVARDRDLERSEAGGAPAQVE